MTLKKRLFCYVLLFAVPLFAQTAQLRSTFKSNGTPSSPYCTPWVDNGSKEAEAWSSTSNYITLSPEEQYQTIIEWGGTIQEKHWEAMKILSDAGQDSIMKQLFDTSGCNIGFVRVPIGACDFDINEAPLSCNETAGDYEMTNFSLKRDSLRKIPLIKMAQKINPKLRFWACPWSPPKWMHDNGKFDSGNMINTPANLKAWALYLGKWAQGYKAAGINIEALCCQNEPNIADGGYPKCGWTNALEFDFYKNYMIPYFKEQNIDTKVFLGVFCCGNYDDWITYFMKDATIRSVVFATSHSYQEPGWGTKSVAAYPDVPFFESEAPFGWPPEGLKQNWDEGGSLFGNVADFANNKTSVYTIWNMVNDDRAQSGFNWVQDVAIQVNRTTKQVSYNPWFWAYKHYGYYVKPGAKVIKYSVTGAGPGGKISAYKNPNGDLILVLQNTSGNPYELNVKVGNQMWKASLPGNSFNTLKINIGTTGTVKSAEKQTVEAMLKNVSMNKSTLAITLSAIKDIQSLSVSLNDLQGRTVWTGNREGNAIGSELQTFKVNSKQQNLSSGTYTLSVHLKNKAGKVSTIEDKVKVIQ
jgi:glucosylceramidase